MKKRNIPKETPSSTNGTFSKRQRIEQTKGYNFQEFSQIPAYREINKELLEIAIQFLPKGQTRIIHVDIGTGTGLVPQLAADIYQRYGKQAIIMGIDTDIYALRQAAKSLKSIDDIQILLLRGCGQDMQEILAGHIPQEGVDIVSIHNTIHEIPGFETKKRFLRVRQEY